MPPFPQNANFETEEIFSSIATYVEPKNTIFDQLIVVTLFSTLENDHFRIRKWPFCRNKVMVANSGMRI